MKTYPSDDTELRDKARGQSHPPRPIRELLCANSRAQQTEKYDPSLPLAFKVICLFKLKIKGIFELNGS
jgi:hypothetical protein